MDHNDRRYQHGLGDLMGKVANAWIGYVPRRFEPQLQRALERSRRILHGENLPVETPAGYSSLSEYVIEVRGYREDSAAGLAARILDRARAVNRARALGDLERMGDAAFNLGGLIGEQDRKRKRDAKPERMTVAKLNLGRIRGVTSRLARAEAAAQKMLQLDHQFCRRHQEVGLDLKQRARYVQPRVLNEQTGKPYSLRHVENILARRWRPSRPTRKKNLPPRK